MTELKWNAGKLKKACALFMAASLLALPVAGNVSAADRGVKVVKGDRIQSPENGRTPGDGKVAVTGIKLDKTSLDLKVKGTAVLKATVSPANATDKSVAWKTSDGKVAKVDKQGKVTAVAQGTATVTATAGGQKAACTVTVVSLKLKRDTATVQVGKTVAIGTASVYPKNDTVSSYTSSDQKVATVDNKGVVKGKKAGKATITVKTKRGAEAAFNVKVVKKASVVLSPKSETLAVKGTTKIKADPARSTSTKIQKCESDKPDIAAVDNKGVVKAKKVGRATITVTMKDGAKAKFNVTVKKAAVELTKKSGTVRVGEEIKIKINKKKSTPAGDTIQKCVIDKKKIASVDNKGVVKGKKAGKATVTVTMKSGAKAKFNVTVKK